MLPLCGGMEGSRHDVTLSPGEHVVKVSGYYGDNARAFGDGGGSVSRLTFTTNRGATYGPYGRYAGPMQREFTLSALDGMMLVGISSYSSSRYVNNISFYFGGKVHGAYLV